MTPLRSMLCSLLLLPVLTLADSPVDVMQADTPRTTVDGHGFVVPAGWSIRMRDRATILTAPEGGTRIALVDIALADADAAVAAAWQAYGVAMPALELASDRPVREGWRQGRHYRYAAAGRRVAAARALRHGDRWTVVVFDLARDVAEKRDAQIELIVGRLLPKGYQRETLAGRTAQTLDAERLDALVRFVDDARMQAGVPGVAFGIVQHGRVVYAGGVGVRAQGKPDKVDADTLFMIASNTKPLTTLMLAKLVDAGRFGWDTPVVDVLPSFRLGDAATTARIAIRHLVCACTGMPRQDMEWIFEGDRHTPASLLRALGTMQPTAAFGELYQYSNLLAGAAGYAGGHTAYPQRELGAAYDAAMQALVFDPLGMTSTTFDFARAQRGNHARPHGQDVDGATQPVEMAINLAAIPSRPDGGAWSNVTDMLRYVQIELRNGMLPDGSRYIAAAPLLARREQQVSRGDDLGYGMGLKIDRTLGTPLLHHGGIAAGYVSDVLWLPEHDTGAVILINADSNGIGLRNAFRQRLLELLFDREPRAVANAAMMTKQAHDSIALERKRLAAPPDAAAAAQLAAQYRHPALGTIDVTRDGTTTRFDFGGWHSDVATRREDDGTLSWVTTAPGAGGYAFEQHGTQLVLRDAQHEYVFEAVD